MNDEESFYITQKTFPKQSQMYVSPTIHQKIKILHKLTWKKEKN